MGDQTLPTSGTTTTRITSKTRTIARQPSAITLSTLSMETSEPQTRGGWARAYVRFEPQELARLVVV